MKALLEIGKAGFQVLELGGAGVQECDILVLNLVFPQVGFNKAPIFYSDVLLLHDPAGAASRLLTAQELAFREILVPGGAGGCAFDRLVLQTDDTMHQVAVPGGYVRPLALALGDALRNGVVVAECLLRPKQQEIAGFSGPEGRCRHFAFGLRNETRVGETLSPGAVPCHPDADFVVGAVEQRLEPSKVTVLLPLHRTSVKHQ